MHAIDTSSDTVRRGTLWFGLLGGAVAWLLHLLLSYIVAEFGCIAGLGDRRIIGISIVAWLILLVSVITLLVAIAATGAAYHVRRQVHLGRIENPERGSIESAMAKTGLIMSGLFVFVIVVESVPILFYLSEC